MLAARAGCRPRSPPSPSPPCAGDGLRGLAAGPGGSARGRAGVGVRRGVRRDRARPGACTMVRTLRRLGYRFAIVSGGFTRITDRLAEDPASTSRGQRARGGRRRITGRIVGPVVDRAGKAAALREFAARSVPEQAVIAIGDGANDLDMLNAAGLGIAYNAAGAPRRADTAVNVPTWTRSSTCWASRARRSRPPTPRPASSPPLRRSDAGPAESARLAEDGRVGASCSSRTAESARLPLEDRRVGASTLRRGRRGRR